MSNGAPVPAVEMRDLHYRYSDGTPALRGVTCTVKENDSIGLIGPNGAGKSTLLLHLNGLLPGDGRKGNSGEVLIFGRSLRGAADRELAAVRREVGLVFQDPNDQLFCPSVWEDIAFGPE